MCSIGPVQALIEGLAQPPETGDPMDRTLARRIDEPSIAAVLCAPRCEGATPLHEVELNLTDRNPYEVYGLSIG